MRRRPEMKLRTQLRRRWMEAAEDYWTAVVNGYANVADRARDFANVSLRLHLFEQGRRSAR